MYIRIYNTNYSWVFIFMYIFGVVFSYETIIVSSQ